MKLANKTKAVMFEAGMYLPGLVFRFTTAAGMFLVMFDFISDWLSTGTVSLSLSCKQTRVKIFLF